jgi:hypothetical protein
VIHASVSPEKLAALRILLFLALSAYALSVPGEYLALLPPGFHRGVGVGEVAAPALLSSLGVSVLRYAAAFFLVLSALGVRPFRFVACTGMLLFTLYLAMLRPGHREIGALYLGYALALGPSAEAWALRKARDSVSKVEPAVFSATLQLATFCFLLTYSFIGVQRLLTSGVTVFTDDSMVWHIASNSGRNGAFQFTLGYRLLEALPQARPLLGAGFLVATVFEALAPLAFYFRKFRIAFLVFMLAFHASNLFLMNIEFFLNVLVLLLLLVDWKPWVATRSDLGGGLWYRKRT